jgi:hypothetical protein
MSIRKVLLLSFLATTACTAEPPSGEIDPEKPEVEEPSDPKKPEKPEQEPEQLQCVKVRPNVSASSTHEISLFDNDSQTIKGSVRGTTGDVYIAYVPWGQDVNVSIQDERDDSDLQFTVDFRVDEDQEWRELNIKNPWYTYLGFEHVSSDSPALDIVLLNPSTSDSCDKEESFNNVPLSPGFAVAEGFELRISPFSMATESKKELSYELFFSTMNSN